MTRTLTAVAIALLAAGPLATTDAEAFFAKRSNRTAAGDSSSTLGLTADQLKIGSKRWYDQMEREGRFGGRRN
jgi:hypothetical protein